MVIKLPPMEKWQKDLVYKFDENPRNKIFVIKSVRQIGKSTCLSILLIYASFRCKADAVSKVISPTFAQARKLYEDTCRIAAPLISKTNSSELKITFINRSSIFFNSAEQGDNLRGFTVRHAGILCVDEAAYIDKDFFYSVLLPMTNVFNANIFLFSTPKFKQGLFYELFTAGELGTNDKVISIDWTKYDTSKYLSPETLEIYRQQLPRAAFNSEFLGEWIDGDGAVFSDFKKCINQATSNNKERLIISIDWSTGSGNDDTAITAGQFLDNKIQVQDIVTFNDKPANETIDYILDYVKSKVKNGYKEIHIIVEKNSIGTVFADLLRQKLSEYEDQFNDIDWRNQIAITTQLFNTSNQSKEKIIKQLCVLFENDKIVIPNNSKLINQLSIYEVKVTNSGNTTYNAPNRTGCHDDTIISLAMLCNVLYHYTTNL